MRGKKYDWSAVVQLQNARLAIEGARVRIPPFADISNRGYFCSMHCLSSLGSIDKYLTSDRSGNMQVKSLRSNCSMAERF